VSDVIDIGYDSEPLGGDVIYIGYGPELLGGDVIYIGYGPELLGGDVIYIGYGSELLGGESRVRSRNSVTWNSAKFRGIPIPGIPGMSLSSILEFPIPESELRECLFGKNLERTKLVSSITRKKYRFTF